MLKEMRYALHVSVRTVTEHEILGLLWLRRRRRIGNSNETGEAERSILYQHCQTGKLQKHLQTALTPSLKYPGNSQRIKDSRR